MKKPQAASKPKPQAASTELEIKHPVQLAKFDIEALDEDSLDDLTAAPVELTANYWTPEAEGETKQVILIKVDDHKCLNERKEPVTIKAAFFVEKTDAGLQQVINGSARLVSVMQQFVPGSAFQITYIGKKKNATNSFHSTAWSVKPLLKKTK